MFFKQYLVGHMENYTYLLACEEEKLAAVVDSSFSGDAMADEAAELGFKIKYVMNTHDHPDHTAGDDVLLKRTGAELVGHEKSKLKPDIKVKDGDIIKLGKVEIRVIHTPGHTPDGVCFLAEGKLLTGDTLFVGNCGRTDLPGGDPRVLHDSLFEKIATLPDDIEVWPGHAYGPSNHSTIGNEKATNFVLQRRGSDEFAVFMAEP